MSPKLLIPLFALAILLSACSNDVITQEQRELPEQVQETQDAEFTGTRKADLSQSFVAFVGSKGSAVSFEGKFNEFDTVVEFANGAPVSLNTTIQIKSMETSVQDLTDHLLDPDFFESETYPVATFVSDSIESIGDGKYNVTGILTMKDVSNQEVIVMTINDRYIQATHTIDRMAHNVGSADDGIDNDVPLEIQVVLQ